MRYFIDTEFQQTDGPNGLFIMPISIGVVAEDGREFYTARRRWILVSQDRRTRQ